MREHVTFYGHFSGWWSYAAVCREIARYLHKALSLSLVELSRAEQVPEEQRLYGVGGMHFAKERSQRVREKLDALAMGQEPGFVPALPGAALVFTNPNNLPAIPQHARMVVYAVCEADIAPASWIYYLNERADVVLTPSTWAAEALARSGVKKQIRVVRHGVDPHVFCSGDGSQERNRVRLFCTSETGNRKGLWEFTHALDQLSIYRPDVIEQVTIHTPYAQLIADIAQTFSWADEIEFVDEPVGSPMDMAELLRQTKLLVAPSRAEGFGLLPLEAACCGCPVVVSDATGHKEYTQSKSFLAAPHGYLVETGPMAVLDPTLDSEAKAPTVDATRLAEVILLALSGARQRHYRKVSAQVASRLIAHRFAWSRVLTEDRLIAHLQTE